MCSQPLVIVLLGPTASGKTDLGLEIAERLDLPVHNVDSRQLYRGMDVGTAKPTAAQQARVKHHLLDLRNPDQPITLQEFQQEAEASIGAQLNRRGMALLVGGSGLYLKAITGGLRPPAVSPQPALRQQLTRLGQSICHPLLRTADPQAADRIAPTHAVRPERALEDLNATGQPMSHQARLNHPGGCWSWVGSPNLRERITQRTKQLFSDGLLDETEGLAERFGIDLPMLQTIGYKETRRCWPERSTQPLPSG